MAGDLIRLMHSLFLPSAGTPQHTVWQPAVDIYQIRDGWLVKVDLAGVLPEDIRLRAQGHRLTVQGVRRDCSLEEGCCHFSMEIAYSCFERTVSLPVNLDQAHIVSEHRHGMLLIRIRTEARTT